MDGEKFDTMFLLFAVFTNEDIIGIRFEVRVWKREEIIAVGCAGSERYLL